MTRLPKPDPKLDLVLERTVDVPPELVWKAWTMPEHVAQWFTPKPWHIPECEIDLRPGGIFRTVMQSPEGEQAINLFCYLDIVPNERLVWTNALLPGYRPSSQPFITAITTFEPHGNGTKYTAMAMHVDEATRQKHEDMGFYDGWGTVLDQVRDYVKTI
ncbi:SRPBCC family protein [Phyllobacterium sp. 628]|uniref:SRPBCC family protein n=1 Tax=Phyllobacterium sp. 628 TaxID=2718938 RepID=UPI00166220C7|nr:SRPBCC family protein [Phyllobacterium sp. 628]QND52139.1 SRPBCC family protein [Phyllobacterium sp. 628]